MKKEQEVLIKQVINSEEYQWLLIKYFQYFNLKNDQFNLNIKTQQEFYFIKSLVSNNFHKKCPKKNLNKKKMLKFLNSLYKLEIDKIINKMKKIYRHN